MNDGFCRFQGNGFDETENGWDFWLNASNGLRWVC